MEQIKKTEQGESLDDTETDDLLKLGNLAAELETGLDKAISDIQKVFEG